MSEVWEQLRRGAKVIVPSTIFVSLFYYYGLRYTDELHHQFGLDDAALGYSPTDYVVRSLNVTVQPLRVVAVAVVISIVGHLAIGAALRSAERRRPGIRRPATKSVGIAALVIGLTGAGVMWTHGRMDLPDLHRAGYWLLSLLLVAYGVHLAWLRAGDDDRLARFVVSTVEERERRTIAVVLLATLLVLVTYGAFEFARFYARDRAVQQARRTEAAPWIFPRVRVFSRDDLALDEDLGISERVVEGDLLALRFRYEGMRLYAQDNGRILLWPADRSPRAGMFVLTETDRIRVEYEPELG